MTDGRSTRALELTSTASSWRRLITRDGEPIVGMPSQTTRGLHMLCKHIRAVHFDRLQREQDQEPEYAF